MLKLFILTVKFINNVINILKKIVNKVKKFLNEIIKKFFIILIISRLIIKLIK